MSPENSIAERLAKRLKETRKSHGLSLEATAKLSGVSRSMLSQIERGESSPTVATLWNLTRALQVDFAGLLDDESSPGTIREIMRANRTPNIDSQGEGCRIRILSPPDQAGRLEIYEIRFSGDAALVSEPHRQGCHEDLTVLEGALDLNSGDEVVHLAQGDTVRYAADCPHAIRATGAPACALLIVQYT
ncbi:MAG: helix-turn-helix domain-containing protein [Hyphomicrobiales bacterium]